VSFKDEMKATEPSGKPGAGGGNDDIARLLRALDEDLRDDGAPAGGPTRQRRRGVSSAPWIALLVAAGLAAAVYTYLSGESPVTPPAGTSAAATAQKPASTGPEALIARDQPAKPAPAPVPAAIANPPSPAPALPPTSAAPVPTPAPAATPTPTPAVNPPPVEARPALLPAPAAESAKPVESPKPVETAKTAEPPKPVAKAAEAVKPSEPPKAAAPAKTAEPEAAAKPAEPSHGEGRFVIQAGTYSEVANASATMKILKDHKYQAFTFDWTDKNARAWHVVRVGPFRSEAEARKVLGELRAGLKIEASIVTLR
jgi:hypothetical protein